MLLIKGHSGCPRGAVLRGTLSPSYHARSCLAPDGSPPPLLHGRDRARLIPAGPAQISIRTVGCELPALHNSDRRVVRDGARPANGLGPVEAWHAPAPMRSARSTSRVPSLALSPLLVSCLPDQRRASRPKFRYFSFPAGI